MKQYERWKAILACIEKEGERSVEQLAIDLDVSVATVRRDITSLLKEDVLIRTRGGVKPKMIEADEPSMHTKNLQNTDSKIRIAKLAASLVHDGDFICMDSGTTNLQMIQFLDQSHLTVVTNGTWHAQLLSEKGHHVFLLGGDFKPKTYASTGIKALELLDSFNFDACFVGANGVSESRGFTTHEMNEGEVKRRMILRSKRRYILADSTKMNKEYFITFCDLNSAILITDKKVEFNYALTPVIFSDVNAKE